MIDRRDLVLLRNQDDICLKMETGWLQALIMDVLTRQISDVFVTTLRT